MVRNTDYHGWPVQELHETDYADTFDLLVDAIDEEVIEKGPLSERPDPGNEGRWFLDTENQRIQYDDGTAWVTVGAGDVEQLDGSGGTNGQILETNGTTAFWSDGTFFARTNIEDNIAAAWAFDDGLSVEDQNLHWRGRGDSNWAARYTLNPPNTDRVTSEAIRLRAWTNGSDTGYFFDDLNGNVALEVEVGANPVVYAHGDVFANAGNKVAEVAAAETITGQWTFSDLVTIADTSLDPSTAGGIRRNGTDVKVHSGGSVVNLSDIGSAFVDVQEDGTSVESADTVDFHEGFDVTSPSAGQAEVRTDVRGTPNMNIPFTQLDNAEWVAQPQFIPTGATLNVWAAGVRTDTQTTPADLTLQLYDEDLAAVDTSFNSAYESATDMQTPLASVAGDGDVTWRVNNATGSTVEAGAVAAYTIEPEADW